MVLAKYSFRYPINSCMPAGQVALVGFLNARLSVGRQGCRRIHSSRCSTDYPLCLHVAMKSTIHVEACVFVAGSTHNNAERRHLLRYVV